MELQGKVAIVTGASRGIGKVIAKAYAREGAKVVVTARTVRPEDSKIPGTIAQTVEEIRAEGGEAVAVRCDVSKEDEVLALAAQAREAFGPVDVLVDHGGVRVDVEGAPRAGRGGESARAVRAARRGRAFHEDRVGLGGVDRRVDGGEQPRPVAHRDHDF